MGKKILLFILTLTILAGVTPASSVGAVSQTGPWSFDELMSAKNEVEAEASVQCTNASLRSACINQIMQDKGGIYYTGLWKFQFNQFTPISMNFATGELEYYFNSTNEYRKYNNKRPYLKDYLTELLIVQVEQGYDNWAADLRAGVKSSEHWRMLYYGVKGDEEDSLLPYDRKTTLNISTPSFDEKYEKTLRAFSVSTFSDTSEINSYDFSECAEGRKCDAWYDADSPFLYFKDFNYSDGLNTGYNNGYNEGYQTGFETGHTIGKNDGYSAGYEEGYGAGYNNGLIEGENQGYTNGYNNGRADGAQDNYDAGHTEGYTEGHTEGYNEGYTEGHENGLTTGYHNGVNDGYQSGVSDGRESGMAEGYQNGYNAGLEAGRTEGYQAGHDEGYEAGYTSGYDAGYNADRNTDMSEQRDDNDTLGNNNTNTDELATGESNTIEEGTTASTGDATSEQLTSTTGSAPMLASNSSVKIEANMPLVKTSNQVSPLSSPETGAPTAENGSIEFPWWLGAIILLSFLALCWLFWPISQKDRKISRKPIDKAKKLR